MFQRTATRLKRKLWWQNIKLWIILIVIILVILAVIISKCLHCDITVTSWSYVAGCDIIGASLSEPHTLVGLHCKDMCVCLSVCLWQFTVNFIDAFYKCPRKLSR